MDGNKLVLETERLLLRPHTLADAPVMAALVNNRKIAAMTGTIPHPYPDGAAEAFIEQAQSALADGTGFTLAIVRRSDSAFMGNIGLRPNQHHAAEIGYWLGEIYWGKGYATEAAQRMIRFAFEDLALHRVFASHFAINTASGRVMQKVGMTYEGTMRQHIYKWGEFHDLVYYGILVNEQTS